MANVKDQTLKKIFEAIIEIGWCEFTLKVSIRELSESTDSRSEISLLKKAQGPPKTLPLLIKRSTAKINP